MLSWGSKGKYDVITEIKKMQSTKPVCIFGEDEDHNNRSAFIQSKLQIEILPGKHHFDDDYKSISKIILNYLPASGKPNF